MNDLQGLQFRGMIQGGVMALVACTVTRLVIQKPITEKSLIAGFLIGCAATFFSLCLAYTRGLRRQGTGEGSAWIGFIVVLAGGVVVGFLT